MFLAVRIISGVALIAAGISVWRGSAGRAPSRYVLAAAVQLLGTWLVLASIGAAFDFAGVAHFVSRLIYPILLALALIILGCGALLWRSGDLRYGAIWLGVGSLFALFAIIAMIVSIFLPGAGAPA